MYEKEINGRRIWLCDGIEIKADAAQYGGHREQGDEIAFRHCPVCKGTGKDNEYTFHVNVNTGACRCHRASCNYAGDYVRLMDRVPVPLAELKRGTTKADAKDAKDAAPAAPENVPEDVPSNPFVDLMARAVSVEPSGITLTDSGIFAEAMTDAAEYGGFSTWASRKYYGLPEDARFIYQHELNGAQIALTRAEFLAYCSGGGVPNFVTVNPLIAGAEPKRKKDNVSRDFFLMEADDAGEEWKLVELVRRWMLPVKTVVFSGNRSVHVVLPVPVDCDDKQYKNAAECMREMCAKFGVKLDRAVFDNARLTRVGGAVRILDDGAESEQLDLSIYFDGLPRNWIEWTGTEGARQFEDDAGWTADVPIPVPPINAYTPPERLPDYLGWLLPRGSVLNIAAEAKMGKSFIAMDIAAHIAAGDTWANAFPTSKARVLYLDFEMRKDTQYSRMDKLGINRDAVADSLFFIGAEDIARERFRRNWNVSKIIRGFVAFARPDVVIIDSAARYFSTAGYENENSNADVLSYYENEIAYLLNKYPGLSVIQLRHTGKASDGQGNKTASRYARGASAYEDTADTAFTITKGKTTTINGATFNYFEFNDVRLRHCDISGTPLTSGNLARVTDADGIISHKWMTPQDMINAARDAHGAELETWRASVREFVRTLSANDLATLRNDKQTAGASIVRMMNDAGIDNPYAGKKYDSYKKTFQRARDGKTPGDVERIILQTVGLPGYTANDDDAIDDAIDDEIDDNVDGAPFEIE